MLEQILHFIHNYFVKERHTGHYSISDNALDLPYLKDGQYFRVVGSDLNDGIYQYPAQLLDEEFDGEIWAMSVPRSLIDLADEIEAWNSKYGDAVDSPYQSESFGGYTYSKGSGSSGAGKMATPTGWQDKFGSRLNQWRKIG